MPADTPGLHLPHRLPHQLSPAQLKESHPHKKLCGYVAPSVGEVQALEGSRQPADRSATRWLVHDEQSKLLRANGAIVGAKAGQLTPTLLPGLSWEAQNHLRNDCGASRHGHVTSRAPLNHHFLMFVLLWDMCPPHCACCRGTQASYWWGAVARIDVVAGPPCTRLVFYGPQALRVQAKPWATRQQAPDGLFGADVASRQGLRLARSLQLNVRRPAGALADIAISGIAGWIAVCVENAVPGTLVQTQVWTLPGIEVFSRPPLPVPSLL